MFRAYQSYEKNYKNINSIGIVFAPTLCLPLRMGADMWFDV